MNLLCIIALAKLGQHTDIGTQHTISGQLYAIERAEVGLTGLIPFQMHQQTQTRSLCLAS